MTLVLNEKYIFGKDSYRIFIINRFLRIYPVYWIVLVLICIEIFIHCDRNILYCFNYPVSSSSINTAISSLQYFLKNIFLFISVTYFTPSSLSFGFFLVPFSWTLGVELLYYLIAPFFVRRKLKIILILILLSYITRILVFKYNNLESEGFVYLNMWFLPSELMFFLFGTISYKIYVQIRRMTIPNYIYALSSMFLVLFTLMFSYIIQLFPQGEGIVGWLYYLSVLLSIPFLFNYTKMNKFINSFGELSYPIYISHSLMILLLPIGLVGVDKNVYPLFVLFLTIIFSFVLRMLIEIPIEKIRQKNLRRKYN